MVGLKHSRELQELAGEGSLHAGMQEPSLLPGLCILLSLSGVMVQKAKGTRSQCPQNAFCVNGTYCTCNPGYTSQSGNKFFTNPLEQCQDTDECKPPISIYCGANAECQNVEGSFYCLCDPGYKLLSGDAEFKNSNENTCQSKWKRGSWTVLERGTLDGGEKTLALGEWSVEWWTWSFCSIVGFWNIWL
ncbi:adhesion G protein-coupled receptor E3-like [Rhinolophus ferrumequinum]|uniref:adhesion G protein-coupled receptor E3-like n=1 Tax=Rhinolophus ferrumequinum TaxID=59479 RepID=UPI00140FC54C|nr:adhesion G protein-coupled receptor E3-like [Rhinolophus ferrumequinum]